MANADQVPPAYQAYAEGFSADRASLLSQPRSRTRVRAPPAYDDIFAPPSNLPNSHAPPSVHEQTMLTGLIKKAPWLTWRVITRPTQGRSQLKCPRYFGGDIIQGEVELKMDKPQTLRGRLITGVEQAQTTNFLEHAHTIWTRTDGDPRNPGPADPLSPPKKFEGKLSGDYTLAFSFPFPVDVDLAKIFRSNRRASDTPVISPMPQTFLEPNVETTIEYDLRLQVDHGLFKLDSKSVIPVLYIPEITPAPVSQLRQSAYANDGTLPGPAIDPEGWAIPKALLIDGQFRERQVRVYHSLYLSKPLSYTRGSVIPCFLEIACKDESVLDALASETSQRVRLLRRVLYYPDPVKGVEEYLKDIKTNNETAPPDEDDEAGQSPPQLTSAQRMDEEEAEVGIFWKAAKNPDAQSRFSEHTTSFRHLEGEIHLAKELVPSTNFIPCMVEYFVQVLPFDNPDFRMEHFELEQPLSANGHASGTGRRGSSASQNKAKKGKGKRGSTDRDVADVVLQSTRVTIATFYSHGPRPKAYSQRAQPSMARRQQKEESDALYQLSSMGLGAFGTY